MSNHKPTIRRAVDDDADPLISLIGAIFAEYPGVILDVENEEPDLLAIQTRFAERGGDFWVAETGGQLVGCVGLVPAHPHGIALCKLYVAKAARRLGLGGRLCQLVEQRAADCGARFVELWSDTRFVAAHRLYRRRGYRQGRQTRRLNDLSNTEEYYFRKDHPLTR